jgi:hypothetical protein
MNNELNALDSLVSAGFSATSVSSLGGLYKNKNIAVCKDLIFGLCVWNGDEWFPLDKATLDELILVQRCIDNDSTFLWHDDLNSLMKLAKTFGE